jgi:hypothetical protein
MSVWFHEDDYCQIELLPKAALTFAQEQARAIAEFGRAHEAPGGAGWTDIFVRPAAPASMGTLQIALDELSAQASPPLDFFEQVSEGFSTHAHLAPRTVAWGDRGYGLIFADFDEARIVQHVWFNHFARPDVPQVGSFLANCARAWDLILADWAWTQVIDLRDDAALKNYLELRNSREQ